MLSFGGDKFLSTAAAQPEAHNPPAADAPAGAWRAYFEDVMSADPLYIDGELHPSHDARAEFPVSALSGEHERARAAILAEMPWSMPEAEAALSKPELSEAISMQRSSVKDGFVKRRELGRPMAGQSIEPAKRVTGVKESKIHRLEADMAKKFNEKVSAPTSNIRASREAEQGQAEMMQYLRGNELFDKDEFLAALAEYELAADLASVRMFVQLNRGNAFKALNFQEEAVTCYQQCMDEASIDSPLGRQLHACALNNLGTVREEAGQLQQALQCYTAALALNSKCNLAAKNRANLHMTHAEKLRLAGVSTAASPQLEIAFNMYNRCLDVDWQLPTIFRANEVPIRLETRIVRGRAAFHLTSNLTHTSSRHL